MSDKILLIALGQVYRSDDGIGPYILHNLQKKYPHHFDYIHHSSDPSDLIDIWQNRRVIIIDAALARQDFPGKIQVINPLSDNVINLNRSPSSHALGALEAIELGKVWNKLPSSLTIITIAGSQFSQGIGLSAPVKEASKKVISLLLDEVASNA